MVPQMMLNRCACPDCAIDLGCTFWDTADVYGEGRNELLVGKALKKHRQRVFLATKVGNARRFEPSPPIKTRYRRMPPGLSMVLPSTSKSASI